MNRQIHILMADDDEEDLLFARDALSQSRMKHTFETVSDGQALMERVRSQRPDLILLDLNMPKKTGLEALEELKADSSLCSIPVVVLTTSKADEDILASYRLGASSFIRKPVTFAALVQIMQNLGEYWSNTVELP